MPRFRGLLFLLPLAALFSVAGCAGVDDAAVAQAEPPTVVAEFAGTTLTLDDFEKRYVRNTGARDEAEVSDLDEYVDFLERYVDFRLKVDEARRIGLHEDPEIVDEVRSYRDQLAQPFLIEREVLDGIIRDLYEKQKEIIAAAHILLLVDEHASASDTLAAYEKLHAIRDSLVAGQLDFGTAALRHSEDPSASRNQGHLGHFSGGRMILAFEEMAYRTPVGEVSPVFRTPFGYHILEVTDRRAAEPDVRASHILVRLPEDATSEQETEAYATIHGLQARLDAGEDFAALAREYSQDPGSAARGGDLGFFGRDRMVAPFADAAYSLDVGERSDVVRTQFGLHIIELTERKEPASFEEQYDALKRLAERLPRTQERRREVGRAHRDAAGSALDTALVHRAVAAHPREALQAQLQEHGFGAYAERVVATVGETSFTLDEFTDAVRGARLNPEGDVAAQVVTVIDEQLDERAVALAAERLEERNPEFQRIMAEYADGVLLFRIKEDSVWNAATQDTLGLRAHYDAHADKYLFPERRRVIGFYSRGDSLLHVAGAMLGEGRNAAEIVSELGSGPDASRPPLRADTIHLATRASGVFESVFDLEPGEFAPPVRHRGEFVLLYLDGIEAPRPMTFDEARAQVVTDYQEVLEQRLVERLRREAGVRLYPDRLRDAFAGERAGEDGMLSDLR